MEIDVRRVTPAGSGDFELLLHEYFTSIASEVGDQDARESARAFLQRDRCWAWIAYAGGVPAGTVSLRALREDACELKHLYVRPDFRKQRIAHALMDTAHEIASDAGFAEIFLDSLESMAAAHRLYATYGYDPCDSYSEERVAHKVFMRKRLCDYSERSVCTRISDA